VGGSFDVWSGRVKRAPRIFRAMGMEWFYRVVSQPRERLHRFGELWEFVMMVLRGGRERYNSGDGC